MAYTKPEKGDRADAPMKRRPNRRRRKVCAFCVDKEHSFIDIRIQTNLRDTFQSVVRFFQEESQETVLNTRELLL